MYVDKGSLKNSYFLVAWPLRPYPRPPSSLVAKGNFSGHATKK